MINKDGKDGWDGKYYLNPYACFECRKSFKRPSLDCGERPCPHCGAKAVELSCKFKPPKKDDKKAWAVVKFLYDNGFRYYSLPVGGHDARYPTTMPEAQEFVKRYKHMIEKP